MAAIKSDILFFQKGAIKYLCPLFFTIYLRHTRLAPLLAIALFARHTLAPAFVRLGMNFAPSLAIAPAVPNEELTEN